MQKKLLCVLLILAIILVGAFIFLCFKEAVIDGIHGLVDDIRDAIFGPDDGVYDFVLAIEEEGMGIATTDDPEPLPGERIHLSAIANYGDAFVGWYADGQLVSTETEYD